MAKPRANVPHAGMLSQTQLFFGGPISIVYAMTL